MFQILDYAEALLHSVSFANKRAPDLVHAWTPRELVRKMTMSLARRYNIPYFVHLEDNETAILLDELPGWSLDELDQLPTSALDLAVSDYRTHPRRSRRFLAGAAGITVLIDRLLEFKPAHVPGIVFFPGYEAAFAKIGGRDEELRATLSVLPDELLTVYTGNVHNSNFREVGSLVRAIALVNRGGSPIKLAMTGQNHSVLPELSDPEIAQYVIERGFVARSEIPRLLAAADLLVQPGQSDEFNDYRFPAKLPEFLVSGRPVILPRSNVGLLLKNNEDALVLERGDSAEIADAVQRLAAEPELAARIGRRGREFALCHLDWAKNVAVIPSFYDQCLARPVPAQQTIVDDDRVVPKLIAFFGPQLRRLPETIETQVALARRSGVYGFCFYYDWSDGGPSAPDPPIGEAGPGALQRPGEGALNRLLERTDFDFPFCICWANDDRGRPCGGQEDSVKQEYGEAFSAEFIREVIPILKDPRYITLQSEPILLVHQVSLLSDPRTTAEFWRSECRNAGIPSVHLVALPDAGIGDPPHFGFDAVVQFLSPTARFPINPWIFPGVDPTSDSAASYRARLRQVTAQSMAFREARAPLIFLNGWRDLAGSVGRLGLPRLSAGQAPSLARFVGRLGQAPPSPDPDNNDDPCFLEATRAGLIQGLADYLRSRGIRIEESAVSSILMSGTQELAGMDPLQNQDSRPHKTDAWFTDGQLANIASTYRYQFRSLPLTYSMIPDFGDSLNCLQPIATAGGDLEDSQRPWVLKAILSVVPPCSRILEISGGEPLVADILDRLGYEVWIVNPPHGTNVSPDYERLQIEYPGLRFVRSPFGWQVLPAPPGGFDCIYSTSVLEHIPTTSIEALFAGMKKYLHPGGWSIHALEYVHASTGADEPYTKLKSIIRRAGFEEIELNDLIARMKADPETHYFPMRGSVSIQMMSRAMHMRVPTGEIAQDTIDSLF
jgi:glycosyltransferase involved in cell wall biosynthesis